MNLYKKENTVKDISIFSRFFSNHRLFYLVQSNRQFQIRYFKVQDQKVLLDLLQALKIS